MVEQKLLKLLLSRGFWEAHRTKVLPSMFPGDLETIYDTLKVAHERYERDLTLNEVRALHTVLNPTLTTAAKRNLAELFQDLSELDDFGADIGSDVLSAMWRTEIARKIADQALQIMEGEVQTLSGIQEIVEGASEDFVPEEELNECTTDLEEILEGLKEDAQWKFNIPTLAQVFPGMRGGDFTILFARPEVGKTAFWVSLVAGPGGFLEQGASVHVICNEEPSKRSMLRLMTAATGMTVEEIKRNPKRAAALWMPLRQRLRVIDPEKASIEWLETYCKKAKPDIIIADQLDKISISGQFSREDVKYGELYRRYRELCKRSGAAGIGITQASNDAEGKSMITYAMIAESKTAKAAEADCIIGIGKLATDEFSEESNMRYVCVTKNKISGWHGKLPVMIKGELSRYIS